MKMKMMELTDLSKFHCRSPNRKLEVKILDEVPMRCKIHEMCVGVEVELEVGRDDKEGEENSKMKSENENCQ